MPHFTLICTDEDDTVSSKEFEATYLDEVVEKTADFLHGVGYCFEDLRTEVDLKSDLLPLSNTYYKGLKNERSRFSRSE
tara:strand:+ start:285 stop:521 length:237 start_codon:yes stop_codon:yes gene_type:complete